MSHESRSASYNYELNDLHAEHAHEGHVCSSTCEHHEAAQHIDFMEPVERHDDSQELGEEHVHGPSCGHVGYEQALFQIDQGKEKSYFHDPHEEHVHGPICGHVEYLHAHTEIDKPHVHDEHCGHLHHHEAAKHVDQGEEHKHDAHAEHAEHKHEKEHVHGPNCGHVEYKEAHKHVDKHVDEPATIETIVDHRAGYSEAPSLSDSHQVETAVAARRVKEETPMSQQQTEAKATAATEESKAAKVQDTSGGIEAASEVKTGTPIVTETSDTSRPKDESIARLDEQASIDADKMRNGDELTSPASESTDQILSIEQPPIEILNTDAIAPANEFEAVDLGGELKDGLQMEMPLKFVDDEPGLELASGPLFTDEFFETDNEILSDFATAEMGDAFDSIYTPDTSTLDFAEGLSADTGMDFYTFKEVPSLQLGEDSIPESLADISASDGAAEESASATNLSSGEFGFYLSELGNGQVSEANSVEWSALVEVSGDELESKLATARTYTESLVEQASEIDPADSAVMTEKILAMIQDMPRESVEELLPLLEKLTGLYDLPRLEELLELYFTGYYQDQSMFGQLFVSSSNDDKGVASIKFGKAVLRILERASKKTRALAA